MDDQDTPSWSLGDTEDYGLLKYNGQSLIESHSHSSSSHDISTQNQSQHQQWQVKGHRISKDTIQSYKDHMIIDQAFYIPIHESILNAQQLLMFIVQCLNFRHPCSFWHKSTEWEHYKDKCDTSEYRLWYQKESFVGEALWKPSIPSNHEPWRELWRLQVYDALCRSMNAYHVEQIIDWFSDDHLYIKMLSDRRIHQKDHVYTLQWIKDIHHRLNNIDKFNLYHMFLTLYIWITHPWSMGILLKSNANDSKYEHHDKMSNQTLNRFWSHWFSTETINHLMNSDLIQASLSNESHWTMMILQIITHISDLGIHEPIFDTDIKSRKLPNQKDNQKLRYQVYLNSVIHQLIIPVCTLFIAYRHDNDQSSIQFHSSISKLLKWLNFDEQKKLVDANYQKLRYLSSQWAQR